MLLAFSVMHDIWFVASAAFVVWWLVTQNWVAKRRRVERNAKK